jgi:hypothetical protein
MHLVVVHHVGGELSERASALAAALETTVYEARQRLVAVPSVVALAPSVEAARERVARLEGHGFSAFVLDSASSPFVDLQLPAREFGFLPDSIQARSRMGDTTELPYDAIRLILRGTQTSTETSEKTVKGKKFSAGLAVATGGLVVRKRVNETVKDRRDTISNFIHVYATKGRPVVFSDSMVKFDGLGERMQASQMLNMQALLLRLRELAPGATFDDRLMRRTAQAQMLGPGLNPDEDLPLASAMLAMSVWRTGRAPGATPGGA